MWSRYWAIRYCCSSDTDTSPINRVCRDALLDWFLSLEKTASSTATQPGTWGTEAAVTSTCHCAVGMIMHLLAAAMFLPSDPGPPTLVIQLDTIMFEGPGSIIFFVWSWFSEVLENICFNCSEHWCSSFWPCRPDEWPNIGLCAGDWTPHARIGCPGAWHCLFLILDAEIGPCWYCVP